MSNRPSHAGNAVGAGHHERQTEKGRAEFIAQRLAQMTWWREQLVAATNAGDVFACNECLEAIRGIYEEHPDIVEEIDAVLLKQTQH